MDLFNYEIIFSKNRFFNTIVHQGKLGLGQSNLSDNEFLCHAYRKRGSLFLSLLDGDFSFALYNPSTNTYFCARDALGIKSLYYTKTQEGYRFSSVINELLDFPDVAKKPNLYAMKTMLFERSVAYRETMYEGIYRLPPGHFMTIENGVEQLERYWFPEKIKVDYSMTEEEASKKLKEIFAKAVERCVGDLEETAFEVSGGLDSSSVVSYLSQKYDPFTLDSYSMSFDGLICDEGEYVDSILKQYPLHHQKIRVGKLDYHQKYSLEHLYSMSPNWPITLTFAMTLPMLEKMKSDGKKIVITGQGGDHLFTGSPYVFYDLFRRFRWVKLYHELKFYPKPWNRIKYQILRPLLGDKNVNLLKRLLRKKEKDIFLRKSSEIINLTEKLGIKNPAHKNELDMVTTAANSTILDGNLFHAAEAYFGIEFRHPFFDRELVEFALSLPPEMKYKQRTIKWIWRKAMEGILPDKIRERKDKAEFSELITQQIDSIDLSTLLDDPYIVKLGLIEQSLINKYRKEYENKTTKYILFLWTIINMEYWYRYNFETLK